MVFAREVEGETLTFGVSGLLLRQALVMFDNETDSLWSQFIGTAIDGSHKGDGLTRLPSRLTTWERWRAETPNGTAMDKAGLPGFDDGSFLFDQQVAREISDATESGLSTHELVLGIATPKPVAYSMASLIERGVVNDIIGNRPIVIIADPDSFTATAYDRTLDGVELTFEIDSAGAITDAGTSSTWDAGTGTAVTGELVGKQLTRLTVHHSFWFGWEAYWPDTELR